MFSYRKLLLNATKYRNIIVLHNIRRFKTLKTGRACVGQTIAGSPFKNK